MVKFLINRPVAVLMVYIALLLLGWLGIQRVPVSPLPDVDIPEITVHVSRSNTSAREIEKTIVQSLRAQLLQVPQLEDIHSEVRDGYALLRLNFSHKTDINFAFLEVNERIDLSMNRFPKDLERPRVVKSNATDLPVFYLNLSLKEAVGNDENSTSRFIQLSEFAGQVIKRRLEQLPEIAFVDMTGLAEPELYITPDPAALAALGLKEEEFKRIIESNNLNFGNVVARDGQLQYNIRFSSASLVSVEDIKNIGFTYKERIFRLKDVAAIGLRQQDAKGVFVANGKPAINLAIIKQPNAKMDDLRQKVATLIAAFENEYKDVQMEQTQDQTQLLDFAIGNLKQDLLLGSFLAFLLMFFFLKNLRAPILIGITIPVSLLLSVLFFYLLNLSINIISLSGLVLGVGLMIDNSIIVIDNISQHRERGMDLSAACTRGTNEIIRPLISSVLTTCSVFVPLIYLSGITGALFYDQAMAVTIGLGVSLVVSITLLPTLYRQLHLRTKNRPGNEAAPVTTPAAFERIYETGLRWVFSHKTLTVMLVTGLMASNLFLFSYLEKERLPVLEQTELVALIDWNQDIHVNENKARLGKLVAALGAEVVQSNALVGEQQYLLNKEKELSTSEAKLYLKTEDSRAVEDLKSRIVSFLANNYPEAVVEVNPPKTIFEQVFGDDDPTLVARLVQTSGEEPLPTKEKVAWVSEKLLADFPDLQIAPVALQRILAVYVDPGKLLQYELSMDAVYNRLRSALNSSQISSLRHGQQEVPIVLRDREQHLGQVLQNTFVLNKKGIPIPVAQILRLDREETYKTIVGGKEGTYIPLTLETEQVDEVVRKVGSWSKEVRDLDIRFTGSYFSNRELVKEMALVLAVSVLLLYFILAAQFESLLQPLIVLLELPISMSGALLMLYVFGSSINLISLIGLVVMCGIIINDSILKIDTINQLRRREGYGLMSAIQTAGVRRLKSIIMTSLTTILSVSPFLFGNDLGSLLQRPMSLALIGGMTVGTLVSLYFIPLVYWFCYRNSGKKTVTSVAEMAVN